MLPATTATLCCTNNGSLVLDRTLKLLETTSSLTSVLWETVESTLHSTEKNGVRRGISLASSSFLNCILYLFQDQSFQTLEHEFLKIRKELSKTKVKVTHSHVIRILSTVVENITVFRSKFHSFQQWTNFENKIGYDSTKRVSSFLRHGL